MNIIPQEYNRYIEPFLGGSAVFFDIQPFKVILSDTNKKLTITYNAIKKDCQRVWYYLQFHKKHHSAEYYYHIRDMLLDDEFKIAACLIYLNRTCFNGIYRVNKGGKFNVTIGVSSSVIYDTDDFQAIAEVLKHANIFNDDFVKKINKQNRKK